MLPVLGMRGRYVGRDKAGAIIEAGVDVPAESYYLRAIARGDIEAVKAVSEVSE
jgi:predicted nucleotidyltransferase